MNNIRLYNLSFGPHFWEVVAKKLKMQDKSLFETSEHHMQTGHNNNKDI